MCSLWAAARILTIISTLFVLALVSNSVSAIQRAQLHVDHRTMPASSDLLQSLSTRLDASETATIESIRELPEDKWQLNLSGKQNFGQSGRPVWFRLLLSTKTSRDIYYLQLRYPHLDYIDAYIFANGKEVARYRTGDKRSFDRRPVRSPHFVFPIELGNDITEVYFRIKTQGVMKVPFEISDAEELDYSSKAFSFFTGLYFGAILIMLIYNSFIYFTVKDKSYLFYLVYIVASALLQLTLTGLSFQYLWPQIPEINEFAVILSATLLTVSAIGFIVRYMGLDIITTPADYIWMNLLVGGFILVLLSNIFISYNVALKATYTLVSLAVLTGFYIGVKYWLKGMKSARFFAWAWFSYLLFISMYILESSQIISPNLFSTNAFSLGSLVELSLLSLAFADKLNEEKELRVKAQDDLLNVQIRMNEDLDSLVKDRTLELEEANERLKALSVTDGLTQLKNRYYFDQSFRREYKRAAREHWPFSVMMIDIDHFKQLNDTHGHLFGDFCLKRAAELISAIIRRPSDTVARYGGEEFAVLLPNTHLDGALRLAEKIREQFKEIEMSDGGIHLYLTVSIGVSSTMPSPGSLEYRTSLLDLADQCLYKAKQNGRDQVIGEALNEMK